MDMMGYHLNFALEQYNWQLPQVEEGTSEDELRREDLVPKTRMPQKVE